MMGTRRVRTMKRRLAMETPRFKLRSSSWSSLKMKSERGCCVDFCGEDLLALLVVVIALDCTSYCLVSFCFLSLFSWAALFLVLAIVFCIVHDLYSRFPIHSYRMNNVSHTAKHFHEISHSLLSAQFMIERLVLETREIKKTVLGHLPFYSICDQFVSLFPSPCCNLLPVHSSRCSCRIDKRRFRQFEDIWYWLRNSSCCNLFDKQ